MNKKVYELTDYRRQYQQHGFFVIPGCISNSGLCALKAQVQRIYEQWLDANRNDYENYAMINMHGLTDSLFFTGNDPKLSAIERGKFFNMLAPESLVRTMASVFGNDLYFHNTQLFFNPYNDSRKPYWHRDMQYNGEPEDVQQSYLNSMLSLHIRIPLIDETGLEVIPGTHKRWDTDEERQIRLQLNEHNNHEALPGSQLIPLKAGDALVFSAHMIHRGNYVNGERLALDLCVGNPHPSTLKYMEVKHLPGLSEIPYIEHPQWFERAIEYISNH